MFHRLDMKPRLFARMQKLDCGVEVPNPNKRLVEPKAFGVERAQAIVDEAQQSARVGPWTDQMRIHMTDEEIVYVMAVWDCCPGSTSFMGAFSHIWNGDVEAYQKAAEKADPYIEKGSKESLNVWLSSLPGAAARNQYKMEHIGGDQWGIRANDKETSSC